MDTSTDRQTGQTDRTDRQDRLKDTNGQKKMDISRDRQTDRQACWQTDRQTDRQLHLHGPSATSSRDCCSCLRVMRGLLEKGSRTESRLVTDPYFVDRSVPVLDISPS